MAKSKWFLEGFWRGETIASWIDVPEKGAYYPKHLDYIGHHEEVTTLAAAKDLFLALCWEAESSGRDYSPFEFTAHAINESNAPDKNWERYEAGLNAAFQAACRKHVTRKFFGKDS